MSPRLRISSAISTVVLLLSCGVVDDREILQVTVGPHLEECVGIAPMECMVVDGELFYESIENFAFEEGFVYRLKLERFDAFPEQDEPPQDASRHGYRLIEILSKTPAG